MAPSKLLASGVAAAAAVLAACSSGAFAYQPRQLGPNPCMAQINGSCFDLSVLHDWPATANNQYLYTFNPCKPVEATSPCTEAAVAPVNRTSRLTGKTPGIAMCQSVSYGQWVGGLLEPLWLFNGVYPGSPRGGERTQLTITYPGGESWRDTVLTVQEVPDEEMAAHTGGRGFMNTSFTFIAEQPFLQYNFVLHVASSKLQKSLKPMFPCGGPNPPGPVDIASPLAGIVA